MKGYKKWSASELNRHKHLLKIIKVELSKIANELTNYKNRAVPVNEFEKKNITWILILVLLIVNNLNKKLIFFNCKNLNEYEILK